MILSRSGALAPEEDQLEVTSAALQAIVTQSLLGQTAIITVMVRTFERGLPHMLTCVRPYDGENVIIDGTLSWAALPAQYIDELLMSRYIGLALLLTAARWQPHRNIAMATLDENIAAQRLNERLAQSIGGTIRRVPVKRFRRSDLGFAQGERHRPCLIEQTVC
ncbi:hypothetical protein [Paenarthrobacter sp. NPDC089316]|uniref:hypothetical protein n=1 Tax=unclassified Paenarthrobacter TaxID=2634190 RepID=UPI00342E288F